MRILKELLEIKKELQNIRVILQSQFVRENKFDRKYVDGEFIKTPRIFGDPLEELRKLYCTDEGSHNH